jgi:hypothetical protein
MARFEYKDKLLAAQLVRLSLFKGNRRGIRVEGVALKAQIARGVIAGNPVAGYL